MYFYLDIPLIWAYQHLSVLMYDLNMIILYIIFPFSTKVPYTNILCILSGFSLNMGISTLVSSYV